MTIRPMYPRRARVARAGQRMAPGGRRWSESPIPRMGRRRTLSVGAGGFEPPATVQGAVHGHTVDNVTLTTAYNALTVADALHWHTAEVATLVPGDTIALTVADATHAHAADEVALGFVALDVFSGAAWSQTATYSWTHTPTTTTRGVVVFVLSSESHTLTSGVTYGGEALTDLGGITTSVGASVRAWFLGSGVPAGAQTVEVSRSDASPWFASCATLTGGGDLAVRASNIASKGITSSVPATLTVPDGESVQIVGGLASGENGDWYITDFTGQTRVVGVDMGSESGVVSYKNDLYVGDGTAYTGFGWTQTTDYAAIAALAIGLAP